MSSYLIADRARSCVDRRHSSHAPHATSIRYRADIDGLRAVAVAAVIMYHFSALALPGGYLGVDIFFVLSGFLITSLIWGEIETKHFTIAHFYERRLRRIMPALLCMLFVSTLAALALLLPTDLMNYGKSLIATLGFVQNVYFWRDTDYFSRAAEEKPLLHLWSLGIEEQFYLLFPLLLVVLARFWRHGALPVVILATLASLTINITLNIFGGASPAFFLLPSRAWELGAGASLALLPPQALLRGKSATMAAIVGLALVVLGLWWPVPAYAGMPTAIFAVTGTSLIIWSGMRTITPIGQVLSLQPIVLLGMISYSLYLWHWPIIVFARYFLVRALEPAETLAALLLMLGCAAASWWFVERPFRNRNTSIRLVIGSGLAGTAVLSVAGLALVAFKGLPARLPTDAAAINAAVGTNYRCPISNFMPFGGSRACVLNMASRAPAEAEIVLFGNSHAQMYAPLIETIVAAKGSKGLLVPMNGCLPIVEVNTDADCLRMARLNLEQIERLPVLKTVVLGLTWDHEARSLVNRIGHRIEKGWREAFIAGIDNIVDRLEHSGKRVILIGPLALPGWDIASVISRERAFGRPTSRPARVSKTDFLQRYAEPLKHYRAKLGDRFVTPHEVQCDEDNCHFLLEGRSLFADDDHLAERELALFRERFEAAF
jgi:peptidoglycan/LPS O-acetylase OafA/YrhL